MMSRGSWFPIIYTDRCNGCLGLEKPRCVQYCPNGVFSLKDKLVIVTNPHKCIDLCNSCEPVCLKKSDSLPKKDIYCYQDKKHEEKPYKKNKVHSLRQDILDEPRN
jgi:NAD-dependent dihydropyrimidine dehydrogenase PreA subunit